MNALPYRLNSRPSLALAFDAAADKVADELESTRQRIGGCLGPTWQPCQHLNLQLDSLEKAHTALLAAAQPQDPADNLLELIPSLGHQPTQ